MKILKTIITVAKWIAVAILMLMLVAVVMTRLQGGAPSLFGYQINVVVTDSMSPSILPGDVIISRTYHDGDPLAVGDVVTYQGTQGYVAGKVITHQVIELTEDPGGGYRVITQGTAPDALPDPEFDSAQIRGIMVYNTVVLKYFYRIMNSTLGFWCLIVLPILLVIGYETMNIIKAMKKPASQGENYEKENDNDAG